MWSRQILTHSAPIRQLLDQFSPGLLGQIEQVYAKKYPLPIVWQLISSQLDCDRLDYLMRDSYFTGASYGKIDLDRILMALRYDLVSQQLVVAQKGIAAIEHYLVVRYFMYAQVYNHHKNIAATWVLSKVFERARQLFQIGTLMADENVSAWLSDHAPSLEQYLATDDGVFVYHLQRWQYHDDPILSDLCRRFLDRDLLKALEVTHLDECDRANLLEKAHHWLTQAGLDANYYAGLRVAVSRGYTLYHKGINIQTTKGLREINELSPLVQTLSQPTQRVWLIYPREIEFQLKHNE